jgi:N-acetylglucosaminyldiphosphoundecaprenol N-acetyl-beta-D-mannosaminyltransferase
VWHSTWGRPYAWQERDRIERMDGRFNYVGASPVNSSIPAEVRSNSRRILGIDFFSGGASQAVDRMRDGGLLVVPAAPALSTLPTDKGYREALLGADMVITDSAMMVLLWNLFERDNLGRLSGLRYFSHLVEDRDFRSENSTLYVMASNESAACNAAWLVHQGLPVRAEQLYVAPMYGHEVTDPILLERVQRQRPKHIVITIGGGVQERLGLYLKQSAGYTPAIHCIGAAIAFRSGDQVYVPAIADHLALGWLLRCLWRPKSYIPRYWSARKLAWLLWRYRTELPPLTAGNASLDEEVPTSVPWELPARK